MQARDIVVVGGSSGAHVVLEALLAGLPAGFPAAVFVVLHRSMHPNPAESAVLPTWFQRFTPLPVVSPTDRTAIEPGKVYIAPAGLHMTLENGMLSLEQSPKEHYFRPSVDPLFRSAASVYGRRAIGVVLSGGLRDGAAGLWQIKKRGGIAIVQEPAEAKYPDMPRSSILEVAVDFVLPIADIAPALIELTQAKPRASNARLLIAEDERIVARNLEERLVEQGYDVCASVSSGEEAVLFAGELQPDLVLMDIRLSSEMSGIQAGRVISERWQIPVVYVSAYTDVTTLEEAKTFQSYGYVVKPFHSEAVRAAVEMALDRREKELRQ